MPDNETIHQVKVEGTESAIAKFEALAAAKEKAASAGGFSGVSGVAQPRSAGYYDFGAAPAAPGTAGNPQANQGNMTVVGGTQTYGGHEGFNASNLTINAQMVTIYATSVSYGNAGGLTTAVSAPSSPGYANAGGAPAAPGTTGTPGNTGGFMGGVRNFLNSPIGGSGSSPWGSASIGEILEAGASTGSIAGLASTVMNAMPIAAGVMLAANTAIGFGNAAFAQSAPGFQTDTQLKASTAAGQYLSPLRQAMMRQAATYEGDTAFDRSVNSMIGGIPIVGSVNHLLYESNTGRHRDQQLAMYKSLIEISERQGFANSILGENLDMDTDDPFKMAKLSAIESGTLYGRGGARVGRSMWAGLKSDADASGGNIGAAEQYRQALMGFAGRSQWGYLGGMVAGNVPMRQLEGDFLQSAAETGDFASLAAALRNNPKGNLDGYFQRAVRASALNVDSSIAGSGLSYTQANTALIGAMGASTGQRAASMDQGDLYFSQLQGITDEQLAISKDPVRVAQLTAQRQQILSQRESNRTAAISLRYQGRFSLNSADMSAYGTGANIAQFGDDPDQVAGLMGYQGQLYGEQADLYGEMSQNKRFSPEERAQYAAQAYAARYQATIGIARQIGGFRQGLVQGNIGIATAEVGAGISEANLFGGIESIYNNQLGQVGITQQQIALTRGQIAGEYGPTTMQERQDLQRRLTELLQQETVAREGAVRGLSQMQVALASTAQGIAGTQQQRAYLTGSGGIEGFAYASSSSSAAAGVARAAQARVSMLRSRGVAEDNPEMQSAMLQLEQAQTGAVAAEVGATQVPFSLGLRQEESRERFGLQALSMFPGQYGSMRALLGKQMGTQEHMAEEITQRRDAHRAQYGGHLPEHLEFEYQQQLQQVALQQAGTFNQLSYGWESRLQSQMMGTPGSAAFITPSMSFKAAVGSGVVNPHMGATQEQVPFFLRQAMLASSIAGATGTPEGFGVTALTGAAPHQQGAFLGSAMREALSGVEIIVRVPLPGGGHTSLPGSVTAASNRQDTSGAAFIEQGRRNTPPPHQ